MQTGAANKTRPFSFRLSTEERAELEARANGQPIGSCVREYLFAANDNRPRPRRVPSKDQAALATVLAKLGQAELAASLRDIAKAARIGALPVSAELEAELHQACSAIAAMKSLLMKSPSIEERWAMILNVLAPKTVPVSGQQ